MYDDHMQLSYVQYLFYIITYNGAMIAHNCIVTWSTDLPHIKLRRVVIYCQRHMFRIILLKII